MNAMIEYPSIAAARLPAVYESAQRALADCAKIDECKSWADKAAAMASYAKQSDDKTLFNFAVKIQARAIRRCGELLREIEPATGAHLKREGEHPLLIEQKAEIDLALWQMQSGIISRDEANEKIAQIDPDWAHRNEQDTVSRKQAATEAGLSDHQRKQALRIANIDSADFNDAIESENPPTITELAEQGTQKKPKPLVDLQGIDPHNYARATEAQGHLRRFSEFCRKHDPETIAQSFMAHEIAELRQFTHIVNAWLERFSSKI